MEKPIKQETLDRFRHALDAVIPVANSLLAPFRKGIFQVSDKSDGSLVTDFDRKAEEELRSRIQSRFPCDEILGEEFGLSSGTSGFRWIIDPIDGTQSFACGVPLFGTLLAVVHQNEPIIGVAFFPAIGELLYACRTQGAWWARINEGDQPDLAASQRLKVERTFDPNSCIVNTTSFNYFRDTNREALYTQLLAKSPLTRGWSDMYGVALALTNRIDLAVEPLVFSWDIVPFMPIATEAGFVIESFDGGRAMDISSVVAGSPEACQWFKRSIVG
jgi:histidinol phosphatase-like enzyme (inositol monophosphatase family)